MNNSGFQFSVDQSTTLPSLKRVLPNATNDVDLGSSSKRIKTLYYPTLDPVPGGGVGGPFLPLDGTSTMTGNLNLGTKDIYNGSNLTLTGEARVTTLTFQSDVNIGTSATTNSCW